MNVLKICLVLIALVLLVTKAFAFQANITGTEVTVTYTEPTTNVDGSPLVDLDHTMIFHNFGGAEVQAVPNPIPATALTGGGAITEAFTVPVPDGVEADVDFWARAYDGSGNVSPESTRETKRIDHLAPGAPQ